MTRIREANMNDLNTPLKACPHCDGKAEIKNWLGERWWQVICKSCGARTGEIKNDLNRTIANWNARGGDAQQPSREAREKEITRMATIEECAQIARAMAVKMLNELATPPNIRGLGPDDSHLKYGHRIADRVEADIKALTVVTSTQQGGK